MKRFILVSVCLMLISAGMFYFISLPHKTSDIKAEGGVLDLNGADFSDTVFPLDGEWEFYYGQLIFPEEFSAEEFSAVNEKNFIRAPFAWDSAGYPVHGYATYRLTVLTDEPDLLMLVPVIQGASAVWINGEKVFTAGTVGTSGEQTVTDARNAFVSLRADGEGRAEIVIQTSNYRWRYSGIYSSVTAGRPEVLITDAATRRLLLAIVLGIFLAMGLYHAVLFMYHRKERASLAFTFVCLIAAVRFYLETNGIANLLTGMGDGLILVLMESTFLHMIAVTAFVHSVFSVRMTKIRAAVYFAFFLIPMLTPFTVMPRLLYFLVLVPAAWVAVSAARSGKMRQNPYTILFFGAMVFFVLWSPFYTMVLKESLYMPGILINLFLILSQGVMLSAGYAETKRNEQILTERNEALDKLNRVKTQFLQDMRHEMKNPLTVIATGVDFSDGQIARNKESLPEVRDALNIVRDETQRLGRMVESMAALASMNELSANRERVDFKNLLAQSAEALRIELNKDVELSTKIARSMPDVFVERDRFTQVMANILANAANGTSRGKISVKAVFDKAFITVRVSDTGAGIPDEILPRIFERGVSGRGGTGYGLYLCKTIVEAHGGGINIESKTGEGTAVTFTVPVYGGQEAGHENERKANTAPAD